MSQKVTDKEQAILDAAVTVFSSRGFWNTPTSLISKTAGVADGTLFNYFQTKDDLINEVYLDIKRELAEQLLDGLPDEASVKDKMRHIWDRFIDWGVANPEKFKVLRQIGESYELSEAVKAQGMEPFVEIERMASESVANGEFHNYPVDYLAALVDAQAAMTIQFIALNGDKNTDYKKIGFDILWSGISR